MFTEPFKTEMSLDLARGPDFQRMTKGTPGDEVGLGVNRLDYQPLLGKGTRDQTRERAAGRKSSLGGTCRQRDLICLIILA